MQDECVSVSEARKRVSFDNSISGKVAAVLEQMKEQLKRGDQKEEEEEVEVESRFPNGCTQL